MSTKFKAGDMVELLSGRYAEGSLHPGMVGTIVEYVGVCRCPAGCVSNAWDVLVDGRHAAVGEPYLRLIPGGSESRKGGDWNLCPWSPYRYKNPVEEPVESDFGFYL